MWITGMCPRMNRAVLVFDHLSLFNLVPKRLACYAHAPLNFMLRTPLTQVIDAHLKSRESSLHNNVSRLYAFSTKAAVASSAAPSPSFKLIVYSKDECHLCEGLKEKLQAILDRAAFMPSPMSGVDVEVRDITTNEQWLQKYSMTIPVLAIADIDGANERELTRPSPRVSADALEKHILKHIET